MKSAEMTTAADFPVAPTHGYRGETAPDSPPARPRGLAVAISRQAGARGGTIARKLGELLGWQVFDRAALDYLVQDDLARQRFLDEIPTPARRWASARLAELTRGRVIAADADVVALAELLLAIAARGDAVIVGRGAGYLLPVETTVHVRVVAPFASRVAYLAEWLRLTRDEAAAEVHARDQRRARFLQATFGRDPTDLTAYDLVVNSERLGVEGASQLIAWAVRTKQMTSSDENPDPPVEPELRS